MFKLLKNINLNNPTPIGICNALIADEIIVYIGRNLPKLDRNITAEICDLDDSTIIPGLIDAHIHKTGGGGESGSDSRVDLVAFPEGHDDPGYSATDAFIR